MQTYLNPNQNMNHGKIMYANSWDETKKKIKSQWIRFTDEEIESMKNNFGYLRDLLQKNYGYSKTLAQEEYDKFLALISPAQTHAKPSVEEEHPNIHEMSGSSLPVSSL